MQFASGENLLYLSVLPDAIVVVLCVVTSSVLRTCRQLWQTLSLADTLCWIIYNDSRTIVRLCREDDERRLPRRTRRPDFRRQQQSCSEVGTVTVHRCATYSLDTRRPRVLRRSASSLEQPSTAHKTYLLHGRPLRELEIVSVSTSILTVVFLSVLFCFMFLFSCSASLLCFCLVYGALIWT